jgi:hypothetical protein
VIAEPGDAGLTIDVQGALSPEITGFRRGQITQIIATLRGTR